MSASVGCIRDITQTLYITVRVSPVFLSAGEWSTDIWRLERRLGALDECRETIDPRHRATTYRGSRTWRFHNPREVRKLDDDFAFADTILIESPPIIDRDDDLQRHSNQ